MTPRGFRYPVFTNRIRDLYFKIEKHIAMGGGALSLAQVREMAGLKSNGTIERYLDALVKCGLINRIPKGGYTITTHGNNYPPVEWRKDIKRSNTHDS